jgi:hypothetical protein
VSDASEHGPAGTRVLVRLGQGHNSFVLVVDGYRGPNHICPELMDAVDAALTARFGPSHWTTFTHVEILRGF